MTHSARASGALIAILMVVVVCLPSIGHLDADVAPLINNVEYDPNTQKVLIQGTSDSSTVKGLIDGPGEGYYSFAFLVSNGKYSDMVNMEGAIPGRYQVTIWNNTGMSTESFVLPNIGDVQITV